MQNDTHNASEHSLNGANIVLLFLIVVASTTLFVVVAYVYMKDKGLGSAEAPSPQQAQEATAPLSQNTQNNQDRTIVREDGAVVHVGTCPFDGGCGDETAIYKEKKYHAKVQKADEKTVVFVVEGDAPREFTAHKDAITVQKVDLATNTAQDVDASSLQEDATVVIDLDVNTEAVKSVYILTGTFH